MNGEIDCRQLARGLPSVPEILWRTTRGFKASDGLVAGRIR
jgi:hypothetical protein